MKNTLYQNPLWDHTSYNEDFYNMATTQPNKIDWTLPIIHLLAVTGCSTTHLASYLKDSRDHIEGVKIGKINKPRKHLVEPLRDLVCKHVPSERLA